MKIKCDFCGIEFERCASKVKTTNNFCSKKCSGNYKHLQNTINLTCEICGKEFTRDKSARQSKSVFCSRECYQKFRKNNGTRKGCKISEETRKKMSLAVMGSKNHCWGTHHSEEHRRKISEGNKGKHGYWTGKKQPLELVEKRRLKQIGHSCSEETREKIRKSNSGKKRTKEQREKYSLLMVEKYKNNTVNPVKNSHYGHFYSDKNKNTLFYRSSYELKAYKILENDNNVISFNRECIKIPYIYDGIKRHYIPDILVTYVNNKKELIEIKAQWALTNPRNKIKFVTAKEYCEKNNLTFKVWTEKELKI